MANDTSFYEQFARNIKLSIHTLAPARVVSFNETKRTADIEILFMSRDEEGNVEKYPLIQGAPVLGHRYKVDGITKTFSPILQSGDVVFVGFAERAMDHLNDSKPFDPQYLRTHSIMDAVVLGVFF